MKVQLELLTNWKFFLPMGVGTLALLWSIFNFVLRKITMTKLTQNDLKHITVDITELKKENKEIKIDLKGDLNRIFRRLGRIEKEIVKREAICNERHPKK